MRESKLRKVVRAVQHLARVTLFKGICIAKLQSITHLEGLTNCLQGYGSGEMPIEMVELSLVCS